MMANLILRNGRIMDGTGSPWYRADLAISETRIVAMGRNLVGGAEREIDVGELIVSPAIYFVWRGIGLNRTPLVESKKETDAEISAQGEES